MSYALNHSGAAIGRYDFYNAEMGRKVRAVQDKVGKNYIYEVSDMNGKRNERNEGSGLRFAILNAVFPVVTLDFLGQLTQFSIRAQFAFGSVVSAAHCRTADARNL